MLGSWAGLGLAKAGIGLAGQDESTVFESGVRRSRKLPSPSSGCDRANGFCYGDCSRNDAGIVATVDLEFRVLMCFKIHAVLLLSDRRRGFYRHVPDNGHTGGDAADDTARIVGLR